MDVVVLETGLGGRFDATNLVPQPIVTGITSLGMDHIGLLGPTLADIAQHKGGIFKVVHLLDLRSLAMLTFEIVRQAYQRSARRNRTKPWHLLNDV